MDQGKMDKIYSLIQKWDNAYETEGKNLFNQLISNNQIEELVALLKDSFKHKELQLIENILNSSFFLKNSKKEVKTIALYYYKMKNGGVERVISLLIPLFIELGYRCILITDEKECKEDYQIPLCVRRYVIYSTSDIVANRVPYFERAKQLAGILKSEQVDAVCYQAASSPILLYDLLLVKLCKIKFFLSQHELFSHCMVLHNDSLLLQMAVFPLVDRLIVLSRTENTFWKTLNVDSVYIPNPYSIDIQRKGAPKSNTIVWVGRIDKFQKQYQEIIPIMKKVVHAIPNAILKVFGGAVQFDSIQDLNRLICDNKLENNIIYCGYKTNINEIYEDAQIHLVTSSYESFGMNIFESKILGIPLVIYDMPYLELLKEPKGYISVRQGDYEGAATAIIQLLTDENLRNRMEKEAKDSVKKFNNDLIISRWKDVFNDVDLNEEIDNSDYAIILKTMAFHFSLGCKKMNNSFVKLRDEKWVSEIKLKTYQKQCPVALYPFGTLGKRIKMLLENNEIPVGLIVDNKLSKTDKEIKSIEELAPCLCKKYLFVICSDRIDIYDELRVTLKKVIDDENIYDLFPREH